MTATGVRELTAADLDRLEELARKAAVLVTEPITWDDYCAEAWIAYRADFTPEAQLALIAGCREREGLRAEIQRLNDRNVEVSVLAHNWMARHDRINDGKPGGPYPEPADVPNIIAERDALHIENDGLRGENKLLTMRVESSREKTVRTEAERDALLDQLAALANGRARVVPVEVLEPFAAIASEYADQEDDGFWVLKDMDVLASKLTLGAFRRVRSALTSPAAKEGT